jgi:Flp pilus assembly pilin Flp
MRGGVRKARKNQSGQAVVEYMIMLVMVLTLMVAVSFAFRRAVRSFWQIITCEVSAACPNCPSDPNVRNKIGRGCRN